MQHDRSGIAGRFEHDCVELCPVYLEARKGTQRFVAANGRPVQKNALGAQEPLVFDSLFDSQSIQQRQDAGANDSPICALGNSSFSMTTTE